MELLRLYTDGDRYALNWRQRAVVINGDIKNLVPALLKIYGSYGKIGALVEMVRYSLTPEQFDTLVQGQETISSDKISLIDFLK